MPGKGGERGGGEMNGPSRPHLPMQVGVAMRFHSKDVVIPKDGGP